MASPEFGGAEETETPLEEADVYKATSSSDYVVVRRVRLFRSKFITFHNFEENQEDNKQWILTSQCDLSPRNAAEIRDRCTKLVRPRGQWAITTLVKPKSIGTRGQTVQVYMFTLSWPTRWAAKGYTSFAFGFEDLETAKIWHTRLSDCLESIRVEKAASSSSQSVHGNGNYGSSATLHARLSVGNGTVGANPAGGGGNVRLSNPAVVTGATFVGAPTGLLKASSLGRKRISGDGRSSAADAGAVQMLASNASPASSPEERQQRPSSLEPAKRALVYDGGVIAVAAAADAPGAAASQGGSARGSSFAVAADIAAAAAGLTPLPPPSPPPADAAAAALPPPPAAETVAMAPKPSQPAAPLPPPPPPPSSTDSEGSYEELEEAIMGGPASSNGAGCVPCRQSRGTSRGDVHHRKQRWVPYKQVNGVAIYHHPQTAGDPEAGVGGEFMVSTVVRGSPRRCLTALTSNCGTTTILGPAIVQEVLQRRQAVDDKEIQRIVVQAPGLAGVICAPRELVVETVLKTDETGPTLMLMFNSCEIPARFVERKPGEQQQAEEAESCQTAYEGSQRSWWRQPVAARVRGGYTVAPLTDSMGLDQSQEALVTCIIKVDLGGVCGECSWLRLVSDLAGWTDAFLDRMLMAVTLLRDEVEQARFVIQPLNMMASSSRAKDRDRDGVGSNADLSGLGAPGRSVESNALCVAVGAAAGVRRTLRLSSTAAAAARAAVTRGRSRTEGERPSLVDGATAPDGAGAAEAPSLPARGRSSHVGDVTGKLVEEQHEEGAARISAGHEGAADGGDASVASESSPRHSLSPRQYESLEEVLDRMRSLSLLDLSVWDYLHQPGKDAPFKIRGPTYLKDRKKIPAGFSKFILGSMDVIQQPPGMLHEHVARFIPAIRQSGAPFAVVVHLVIPGTPLLGIVATFVKDRHPASLGTPPAQPMEDDHDWEPFDFVLHKYMSGSTYARNHMLKLIPHIADGSWMIKQSVGTTPVILGKQLKTTYYETPQYIEIDIDISANNVASYVTGLVRGATRSLVIDMGFVLEGTTPWELPEALLGTLRLYNLDIRCAKLIDVNNEIPLRPANMAPPPPLRGHPYTTSVPTSAISGVPSAAIADAVSAAGFGSPSTGGGGGTAATPTLLSGRTSTGGVVTSNVASNGSGNSGGAVTAPAGGAAASTWVSQSNVSGKSTGAAVTSTGMKFRAGELNEVESAPANSPASEGSPNGGASGIIASSSVSPRQTPSQLRGFTSVSTSGVAARISSTAEAATAAATAADATIANSTMTPRL